MAEKRRMPSPSPNHLLGKRHYLCLYVFAVCWIEQLHQKKAREREREREKEKERKSKRSVRKKEIEKKDRLQNKHTGELEVQSITLLTPLRRVLHQHLCD